MEVHEEEDYEDEALTSLLRNSPEGILNDK